jgi:hypothetical protein
LEVCLESVGRAEGSSSWRAGGLGAGVGRARLGHKLGVGDRRQDRDGAGASTGPAGWDGGSHQASWTRSQGLPQRREELVPKQGQRIAR